MVNCFKTGYQKNDEYNEISMALSSLNYSVNNSILTPIENESNGQLDFEYKLNNNLIGIEYSEYSDKNIKNKNKAMGEWNKLILKAEDILKNEYPDLSKYQIRINFGKNNLPPNTNSKKNKHHNTDLFIHSLFKFIKLNYNNSDSFNFDRMFLIRKQLNKESKDFEEYLFQNLLSFSINKINFELPRDKNSLQFFWRSDKDYLEGCVRVFNQEILTTLITSKIAKKEKNIDKYSQCWLIISQMSMRLGSFDVSFIKGIENNIFDKIIIKGNEYFGTFEVNCSK